MPNTSKADGRHCLFVGMARSGATSTLIATLAERLASPDARGLVFVPTRLARATFVRHLLRSQQGLAPRVIVATIPLLRALLEGRARGAPSELGDAEQLWPYLRRTTSGDLRDLARQASVPMRALLPAARLPMRYQNAQRRVGGDRSMQLAGVLGTFEAIAVDGLEACEASVLQTLEQVANDGVSLIATYNPDQVVERPKAGFTADPLSLLPTVAHHRVPLGNTTLPAGLAGSIRAIMGTSDPTCRGHRTAQVPQPATLDDGSVHCMAFDSEDAARRWVTRALALTHPSREPAARRPPPAEQHQLAALSRELAAPGESVVILTAGFLEPNPFERAARANGLRLTSWESGSRLPDDRRLELYIRYLNGGLLVGRRDTEEELSAGEVVAHFCELYLACHISRAARSTSAQEVMTKYRQRLVESPDLVAPVEGFVAYSKHEMAKARELLDGLRPIERILSDFLLQWERFERRGPDATTAERISWLVRHTSPQVPHARPGGQRLTTHPLAQTLLTDEKCPADARLAARFLQRKAMERIPVPLEISPEEVLVLKGWGCHGVQAEVVIVWGVDDNELVGFTDTAEALRRAKGRLALMLGRAGRRVVLVSWRRSYGRLVQEEWFTGHHLRNHSAELDSDNRVLYYGDTQTVV